MITIERKVHFRQGRHTRKELREGNAVPAIPSERVPRVSRLMALAIRFDQLIRDGVVTDQAELARLGHVTRARVTQIMNLLCLAPDIQEALLMLQRPNVGAEPIRERHLRPIAAVLAWRKQRRMWMQFLSSNDLGSSSAVQQSLALACEMPSIESETLPVKNACGLR